MSEWKTVRLGDMCEIQSGGTPSRSKIEYWKNGNIPWVKIGDFSGKYLEKTSEFITQQGLDNSSAKLFSKGTILYSIFATLGEVSILNIDATTNQAIAGIKLRNESEINIDFFYLYLKSLKDEVNRIGRGVAQNNINLSILKNFIIPLPPLETQKQIAAVLDKCTSLISKYKKMLEKYDTLIKSRFIEMFGDPVINEKGWDLKTLPELGEFGRGVSKHRPRNAPELLGGKYPLIQTGDVANANLYITDYESTYSEEGFKQSKMWRAGTLCITIAATIAKTAILTFDSCFPDSVVGFTPNEKTNSLFINYWFSFFQKILEEQAPAVAQKNINLQVLSELKIITPPISLQNQFATFVQQIDKSKFEIWLTLQNYDIIEKECFKIWLISTSC